MRTKRFCSRFALCSVVPQKTRTRQFKDRFSGARLWLPRPPLVRRLLALHCSLWLHFFGVEDACLCLSLLTLKNGCNRSPPFPIRRCASLLRRRGAAAVRGPDQAQERHRLVDDGAHQAPVPGREGRRVRHQQNPRQNGLVEFCGDAVPGMDHIIDRFAPFDEDWRGSVVCGTGAARWKPLRLPDSEMSSDADNRRG